MKKTLLTTWVFLLMTMAVSAQQLGVGHGFTVALCDNGSLYGTGLNGAGQLGLGNTNSRNTFQLMPTPFQYTSVGAGYDYAFAVRNDGTVWGTGANTSGQLGAGAQLFHTSLVQMNNMTNAVHAEGGSFFSVVLKADGTVWTVGDNGFSGKLGNGTFGGSTNVVGQVQGLTQVVKVSTHITGEHALALKSDGTVWAWGKNGFGQLGDVSNTNRNVPVQVFGLTDVVDIGAGSRHSMAVKQDGTLWTWGNNQSRQLGNGNNTSFNFPLQITSVSNVKACDGGSTSSAILTDQGTILTWGNNSYGQLGHGSLGARFVPSPTSFGSNNGAVYASDRFMYVVKVGGGLAAAGQAYNSSVVSSAFGFPGGGTNIYPGAVTAPIACTVSPPCATPAMPASITGDSSICEMATVVYAVAPVSGATSYTWTLPNGWSGTSTTNSISVTAGISGGTIEVTADVACGKSAPQSMAIAVNSPPDVSTSANVAVCAGSPTTLTATGAATYTWDNNAGSGATTNVSPTSTTTYTVTGTDGNGCIDTDSVTVTVDPLPSIVATADVSLCMGESTILGATGANSYTWDNSGGNGASVLVGPSATTVYTVTGTDLNGCEGTDQVIVTVNPLPNVTASPNAMVCTGASTNLTVTGASTYTWDNSAGNGAAVNVSPTATTTYTVTGTDGNSCSNTDQVTVTVNSLPTVSAGAPVAVCAGSPANLSASGASTYIWDNNAGSGAAVSVSPTNTTTYTVTGTDANGCQNTDQVTVTVNALPNVAASSSTAICAGASATLTVSGASTYTWDNSAGSGPSVSVAPNATTTYTVTGTDGNGCMNTDQVTVSVNALPNVSTGANSAICNGAATTLTASGASTYTWDNSAGNGASVLVSPTTTTTYTVTGTDGNGCENTGQVTVTVNALPTITTAPGATLCEGASANLAATGATTYTWDNGAGNGSSVTVSPNTTTTYTVTGTDANGCQNTGQVTIIVNPLPNVAASPAVAICEGDSTLLSVSGASTYTWDNGAGNGPFVTVSPSSSTTYTVTGTDANGCVNTDQVTVTFNASPNISTNAAPTICNGTSTTLVASGASTYTWNNGAGSGASVTISPTATTTYTVTGTDANGCQNSEQVTVTVNQLPTVTASPAVQICAGESTGISASGASTYTWDNGIGNGAAVNVTPTATTTYTVTGTDANGCENTDQVTVTVATVDASVSVNGNTLTANAVAATYQWLDCDSGFAPVDGANAAAFTPQVSGTYAVEVTENGCTDTSSCNVVVVVGLSETDFDMAIAAYPNPFQEKITVNFGQVVVEGRIALHNGLGQIVQHFAIEHMDKVTLALDAFPQGVYYLHVRSEIGGRVFKMIKTE